MKILVTGGSGFIGTHLVSDLLKEGHRVTIYDKQPSEKYPDLCILGDTRDREKLSESMRGMKAVYHLAAEHRDDVRPVSLYSEVNVGGAQNVVCGLKRNSIDRLIFTSTTAVYGLNSGEKTENSSFSPYNEYSRSKCEAEVVLNRWAEEDKRRCSVIVRPTAIFGEGNRGNVYTLLYQIASGRFIFVGNGKNRKSLGYVRNISRFLVYLLASGPGRHLYNYADKPDLSTEELVQITLSALGKENTINSRLPYLIGLMGGYAFDLLSFLTRRQYPISSVRVKKFCTDTRISTLRLRQTQFSSPYSLIQGLNRTILSEFTSDRNTK